MFIAAKTAPAMTIAVANHSSIFSIFILPVYHVLDSLSTGDGVVKKQQKVRRLLSPDLFVSVKRLESSKS
jgi:hypothetical protein